MSILAWMGSLSVELKDEPAQKPLGLLAPRADRRVLVSTVGGICVGI